MKRTFKLVLLISLIGLMSSLSSLCLALNQEFDVKDGDSITVMISSQELSKISIKGDGRISKVWGGGKALHFQADKANGDLYIKPKLGDLLPNTSFFIKDDMGATYTLVVQAYTQTPAQSIVLKPRVYRSKNYGHGNFSSLAYKKAVKVLMKAMALGEMLDDFYNEDHEQLVPLWKETEIGLIRTYVGEDLVGEVYSIKNISDEDMVFDEREFLGFGRWVGAVSLERLELAVEASTYLYVVRSAQGGGEK